MVFIQLYQILVSGIVTLVSEYLTLRVGFMGFLGVLRRCGRGSILHALSAYLMRIFCVPSEVGFWWVGRNRGGPSAENEGLSAGRCAGARWSAGSVGGASVLYTVYGVVHQKSTVTPWHLPLHSNIHTFFCVNCFGQTGDLSYRVE